MLNTRVDSKRKNINFAKLEIGDAFIIYSPSLSKNIKYEKLTNNLAEDELGNPTYMVSSDCVIIEQND